MKSARWSTLALLSALVPALALAQEAPAAPQEAPAAPSEAPAAPSEAPAAPTEAPVAQPAEADPHGDEPHGHGQADPAMTATMRRAFRDPVVARGAPSPAVPPGSIRVRVLDAAGQPVPNLGLQLGVMRQGGDRERTPGQTDASGLFTYANLPTGTQQAYRVNAPYEGATYSSTPFQLPTDQGYDVEIQVSPSVHSDRNLFMVLGQTMLELREERLHVIQQVRLSNFGDATYLFPEGGTHLELPEGFTAFQTQPVMTDQHVEEVAGEGLAIRGSLPTGQVTLAWAFDLPVTGDTMELDLPNPFRTFQYRVITTAPEGMELDVDGMPAPVRFEDQGQPLLGTELQRTPDQAPFSHVRITLRGIPGPSPARWWALGLAGVFLLGGLGLVAFGRGGDGGRAYRARRKRELVEEDAQLARDLEAGEIGPQYRQSRHEEIVRELAVLLYQDERAGEASRTHERNGAAGAPKSTARA